MLGPFRILAGLWMFFGVCALIEFPLFLLVVPAFALWRLGVREPIVSSAHGPPFLTLIGISIVYWIPALILYALCSWQAEREAGGEEPGD